ncbi:MAG TPA: response regulator [Caulobacter sp.]|nr:response regulator [Caulobacter sp.]
MDRLDRLIERRPPLPADAAGAAVAAAFAEQPDALALAVVDADGRPVGLVRRQAFEAAGAEAAAVALMDSAFLSVEGAVDPVQFREEALAEDPLGLAYGFVVTDQGRYLGVGGAHTLLAARSQRARQSRDNSIAVTQALAVEVLRQLDDARTFIDALSRQSLPSDARSCADALGDAFDDVRRLMRRAAAVHAAEAGLAKLDPQPTVLREVIDALQDRWGVRAASAGVTLLCAYDGAPDLAAEIDPVQLGELFDGLVDRALSATRRGAVEVTLSARPAVDGLILEARVRDAGETPDPADLAHIFEALGGHRPLSVSLGMAHAAAIAKGMNGVIRAEANPGAGATVVVSLVAPEAVAEAVDPNPGMIPTTAHILIVDDNATNRMVAEALCEMFDCTSEQAVDGVEAVEAAAMRGFDLILMDIKMPRMDGVAATRAIRALPGPAGKVPIVALTANADPSDVRGYLEAGMNDVVEKPIKAERLLSVLDKVLNGTPETDDKRNSAAA